MGRGMERLECPDWPGLGLAWAWIGLAWWTEVREDDKLGTSMSMGWKSDEDRGS
jgi:hypothetical protein